MEYIADNKKIFKNTIVLYIKLVINTIVGVLSTRYVLQALGVESYGLYSVVGGIVSMMNFLNTSMVSTSYRFIAVEYGKKENGDVNKVYNIVRNIHFVLAVLLFLVADIFGIWYIDNYLNVDIKLIDDAYFILHISVITSVFSVLNVPHQGLVTADENFIFSSLVEVLRSVIKLILVIFLIYYIGNRLRMFSIIMALLSFVSLLSYSVYSNIKYKYFVKFRKVNDVKLYKDIFVYAWWIMFGAIANIGLNQGSAMVINFYFGTILNSAYGISKQVYSYTLTFARSISQAAVPQITKSYTAGETDRSNDIVYSISKYTFFMMYIIAVPIMVSMKFLLNLWLVEVPQYTYHFTCLLIIDGLINCIGAGIFTIISATGKIRMPQIFSSIILLMTIPFTILAFSLDFPPYYTIIVAIIASILNIMCFVYFAVKYGKFNVNLYFSDTIYPVLKIMIFTCPLLLFLLFDISSWILSIFAMLISFLYVVVILYLIGLNLKEKQIIKMLIFKYIKK